MEYFYISVNIIYKYLIRTSVVFLPISYSYLVNFLDDIFYLYIEVVLLLYKYNFWVLNEAKQGSMPFKLARCLMINIIQENHYLLALFMPII